jgi:hypothetical protein
MLRFLELALTRLLQRETDTFPRFKFYPAFLDLTLVHGSNEQPGIFRCQIAINLEALLIVAEVENDEQFCILVSFDEGEDRFIVIIDNSKVSISLCRPSQIKRSGSLRIDGST